VVVGLPSVALLRKGKEPITGRVKHRGERFVCVKPQIVQMSPAVEDRLLGCVGAQGLAGASDVRGGRDDRRGHAIVTGIVGGGEANARASGSPGHGTTAPDGENAIQCLTRGSVATSPVESRLGCVLS